MTFASDMTSVGRDLLQELGQQATIIKTVEGSFNPATGDVGASTTTTFYAYGNPSNFNKNEIDNHTVLSTDLSFWMEVNISGNIPEVGDTCTISNKTYRILNVRSYVTQGVTVLYRLQLRI
jgi:hypothetical protein